MRKVITVTGPISFLLDTEEEGYDLASTINGLVSKGLVAGGAEIINSDLDLFEMSDEAEWRAEMDEMNRRIEERLKK